MKTFGLSVLYVFAFLGIGSTMIWTETNHRPSDEKPGPCCPGC